MTAKLQKYLSTVVGSLVTISLSLFSDFILKLPKEITWLTFFIGSIITVAITLLEQKLIEGLSLEINRRLELYTSLTDIDDPEIYQLAQKEIIKCIETVKNYKDGIIPAQSSYLLNRISHCQKTYQATFLADNIELLYRLETDSGKNYYDLNIEAVKRGVKIERIFMINRKSVINNENRFHDLKVFKIISKQHKDGINVRICWIENLEDYTDSKELYSDFGIIDKSEVLLSVYNPRHKVPQIQLIKQRHKVEDFQDIFQKLWSRSRLFNDVINEYPPIEGTIQS